MSYRVQVSPEAWLQIRELPGHVRQRVRRAIDGLKSDPRPPDSKELRATPAHIESRRLRIDRWRIIYGIDEAGRSVQVVAVRKRPPYDYGDLAALLGDLNGT